MPKGVLPSRFKEGGWTREECLAASAAMFGGERPEPDVSPADIAGARETLELGEADQPGHRVTAPVKPKKTKPVSPQRALF